MAMAEELPKIGEKIPVDRFHVSEINMRYGEPFGESEDDQLLIANLTAGDIIEPFIARPEGEGYGVVIGSRRFSGKVAAGAKEFTMGFDCLIRHMTDEEARESSLIENFEVLRKTPDPILRARKLKEAIDLSSDGLRGCAKRWGVPPSTLSEWLKVLGLSPKMQEAVQKGILEYTDGVRLSRMELEKEQQEDLAEVLEAEGTEAFRKELERVSEKQLKRGIPKGVYYVERITWDKRDEDHMQIYESLGKFAEEKGVGRDEYSRSVLTDHVKRRLARAT